MLGFKNFVTEENVKVNEKKLNSIHSIKTEELKDIRVNSIHHQMIYPYNLDKNDYKILAWSEKNLSTVYLDGKDRNMVLPNDFVEIEACYFKNTNALGWQYHPEMMGDIDINQPALTFTRNTFAAFYNNEL
jgi:gamma-glutamyl-gamma-aminobutyrate hydrolase PuuD